MTQVPTRRVVSALLGVATLVGLSGVVAYAVPEGAAALPATAAAAGCPSNHGAALAHPAGITSTDDGGGCGGYLVANSSGQVSGFGSAVTSGDMSGQHLNAPVIGITATPGGRGYYLLAADGGIFSFGGARFFGSTGGQRLNQPVVSMAVTPDGGGYWLVASDGGVFSFGDARFYGSMGGRPLNRPVVGMAATPGGGYWLVASDGGIFSFGGARFYGSMGGRPLNRPVVGILATPDGGGYRMVAADGGVFTFGAAPFYGSLGGNPPPTSVVGLAVTPTGTGYYMMDAQGDVYPFGAAPTFGGAACAPNDPGRFGVDPNVMANDGGGTQLITVSDPDSSALAGTFTAWSRQPGGCWTPMAFGGQPSQPYRVETGYGGIKPVSARVPGDGSTPSGVFGVGSTMYGLSGASPNPAYAYRHLTCGSWWDEAPGSPTYDSFQQYPCGVTPAFAYSAEALWTETVAYVHFAEILMPHPPQNVAGIFLHDNTTSGHTAGCVALPPGELDAVLGWLNPAAQPHFAVGTAAEMNGL